MGWFYPFSKRQDETPADYLTRELSHENGTQHAHVLATAKVGNTIYAAIRNSDTETGTSYVFCGIILIKNTKKDGFGYKELDEASVPNEVACPDRIMALLSPVEMLKSSESAAEWRRRVAQHKQRQADIRTNTPKLKKGDTIKLPQRAHFPSLGVVDDQFTVVTFRKRTPVLAPVSKPHLLCRLHRRTLATATITTASE